MDADEQEMHFRAGEAYGHKSTCGVKVGHHTEEKAVLMASRESERLGRELEAYPCHFCRNWHIGRKMTGEERVRFSSPAPVQEPWWE